MFSSNKLLADRNQPSDLAQDSFHITERRFALMGKVYFTADFVSTALWLLTQNLNYCPIILRYN